jgi:hypothetical protein
LFAGYHLPPPDVPVRLGSRAGTPPFDWEDPRALTFAEAVAEIGRASAAAVGVFGGKQVLPAAA